MDLHAVFPKINANHTLCVHHCSQFIIHNMDISTANTGDHALYVADDAMYSLFFHIMLKSS